MSDANTDQINLARKLLKTVRHAAFATVNEDGSPHSSPLMFIHNEALTKLYIGSHSESLHSKNLVRTGKIFVVLFDSFTKGQGGVNAKECESDDLVEALRVHNQARARHGSDAISADFYLKPKPSQRMYSIEIAKIEIYTVERDADGLIAQETRAEVAADALLPW